MHLKGAKIRNIYFLCTDVNSHQQQETPLSINIPHYQRPFKWDEEKIELLITDFFENYNQRENDSEKEYFAGSIVTVTAKKCHDLIDGQQRITTVFLVNYLKFVLLRAYIKLLIQSAKYSKLDGNLKQMTDSYCRLIQSDKKNKFDSITTNIMKILDDIESLDDHVKKEEKNDELFNYYCNEVGLPCSATREQAHFEQIEFDERYEYGLENILSEGELNLQYSRKSLNDKLKDALKKVKIQLSSDEGPTLSIINKNKIENDLVKRYIECIETIYKSFIENIHILKPDEKTESLINDIETFLEYLIFCVIQTGNTDDAYTLFEVLNDRALEVDDLDLIKNLFYRTYCQKSPLLDEEKKDTHLEFLDNLWGDTIFDEDTVTTKKKLISYLGAIFLTGNTSISINRQEKYRKPIEEYLKERYNDQSYTNIEFHFRIFHAIKIILEEVNLKFNRAEYHSFVAENSTKSITFKTIFLLKALKQDGVLAALINIILKSFIEENNGVEQIDINEFKNYVFNLMNDLGQERFILINQCAYNIWKLAMLSNKYDVPREYSKRVIQKINYNELDTTCIEMNQTEYEKAISQFRDWINDWEYSKSNSNNFKVKLLFMKLLSVSKEGDTISFTNLSKQFTNLSNIQLDHFEPITIDNSKEDNYFINAERDRYVNELGNFMLLERDKNTKLGNKPAEFSFEFYKQMGLPEDHWIISEMKILLEKHCSSINPRVPTEEFFNIRKKNLSSYFLAIIDRNLDEFQVKIKDY